LYYSFIDLPEALTVDPSAALEPQLHAEIEQLRAQFSNTQELYREVCVLLFFRHGITPTANRLYQLVRKDSMSAPADALARFWATLREKSRVRIDHPDLPAELQSATGELAAAVWTRAVDVARDGLAAARHEAQLAAADAQARQAAAEAGCERLRQELAGSAAALDDARRHVSGLEQALAAATATGATLQDQVREAQQGEQRLQSALEAARRDFTAEVDRLRADGTLAQERLRAAEARALLEIDRERGVAARLQKELEAGARRLEHADARHRAEAQTLQGQLGDVRQQIGALEGTLASARAAHARDADELARTRERLTLVLAKAGAGRQKTAAKPVAGRRKSVSPGVSVKRRPPRTPRT
jgi:DNA repair exonuclease SbcCD ATPase subunit